MKKTQILPLSLAIESKSKLEAFIKEREPLHADKEALGRYIDASAIPLDNRTKGRSK